MINLSFLNQYGPLGNGVKGNMKQWNVICDWVPEVVGGGLIMADKDETSNLPIGPASGETSNLVVYEPSTEKVNYFPSTMLLKIGYTSNGFDAGYDVASIKDLNGAELSDEIVSDEIVVGQYFKNQYQIIRLKPTIASKNGCPNYNIGSLDLRVNSNENNETIVFRAAVNGGGNTGVKIDPNGEETLTIYLRNESINTIMLYVSLYVNTDK